jgi:hypothetical protein
MKVAVLNFSGNVGKSTIARHLLLPRLAGADLIAIESLNDHEGDAQALRGRQFGELQEYLQTVDSAVVDIGASNIEGLLELMRRYRGSHEDFDCFVVPTVPALKQQQDTLATLAELARIGVPASRLRLVFNMVEDDTEVARVFERLLAFVTERGLVQTDPACKLGINEIYARVRHLKVDLQELANDDTDFKALIAQAPDMNAKLALAQKLANRRLALGVVPELDACFAALALQTAGAQNVVPLQRAKP